MSESDTLYKISQRRLVASLLYVGEGGNEVFEVVNPEDIDNPSLELILTAMVQLTRKNETISPVSVARELETSGKLAQAGGIAELHALYSEGEKFSLEAPIQLYAEILRDTSAKAKITQHLEEAKKGFKDDSGVSTVDAVSELQSTLNQQLVGLSNDSTVTRVQINADKYEELIEERREISESNKEQADGLQGIPSLLPTLNKFTHGWSPSQMITVGARTGVGKALSIDTPILTSRGWSTMGELSIGDQVYGRDGKLTKITNMTDYQYDRKVYEVKFNNGEVIYADADHLWLTTAKSDNKEAVRTTEEIKESLIYSHFDEKYGVRWDLVNHSIRLTEPLRNDERDFLIEPFKLGRMLAEGDLRGDFEGVEGFFDKQLLNLLDNCLSGSEGQRREFVRGVLLNDPDEVPYVYFSDYEVAENVRTIFASLGYTTFLDYEEESSAYRVSFYGSDAFSATPCVLIVSVKEVDSIPVKCIEVDNEDHTYLAGKSLIPTHNSVFAVNNAVAAARAGKSVLFFTLEMSNEEIDDRIIASMSGVSMSKLKEGNLNDEDKQLVRKTLDELKDMKIMVDSDPRVTVDTIRARAFKQAQSAEGLDLVIVDYLQLIAPVGNYSSRQEAVADISRNMKLTAKTLEVPIIVLVQLNRGKGDDDEENKLPSLDNIRESGSIAMDSDVVILLHRDNNLDDSTPHTLVILDKNRNGESHKVIRCHSNLECSLFREVKKEKEATDERLSEEDYAELEADIDLEEFENYDFDDDMDL